MAWLIFKQNDITKKCLEASVPSSSFILDHTKTDPYHFLDIEIDEHAVKACRTGICYQETTELALLNYHELPDFMKGNPFVVQGYRAMLPLSMCIRSLLLWTNETVNIWSHFLGFYIFLLIALYDNLIALPQIEGSFSDHIILTLGLACYMFCMLCSAGFHTFCCHSEKASRRWLAVDMTGVSIGIIGCYLPSVYYAFYCQLMWRNMYLLIITILSVCTLVFQLHPRFFTNSWFYMRMAVYVGLSAYGVVPTIHWVYLSGGVSTAIVQMFLPKVIMMYLLGVLAFSFYISKLPERACPGKFDYIGSSHQLWHFLIVLALCYWHKAGEEILIYRISNQCVD
ncbi:hypothetical protein BsWGS_20270 [Bradybaena similaris]